MKRNKTKLAARVTLDDVARKIGISAASVSVALRGKPGVSARRRKEIKRVAASMGYEPELMARTLALYRHNKPADGRVHSALAWINWWPDPKQLHGYTDFHLYWQGASDAAAAYGYRLDEFTLQTAASGKVLAGVLRSRGIHGILIPPHPEQIDWTGFDWDDFAVVRFGHSQTFPHAFEVAPDQVENIFLAYDKIEAAGYRRIGYAGLVGNVVKWWWSGANWMRQMVKSSSEQVPMLKLRGGYADPGNGVHWYDSPQLARQLREWIVRYRVEAIICEHYDLSKVVANAGLKVPQDVAMIALNINSRGAADTAGIDQNPYIIGQTATDTLLGLMRKNELGELDVMRTVTVMGNWVPGASLPPKSSGAPAAAGIPASH